MTAPIRQPPRPIKAVLFDLDGTMVDSKSHSLKTFLETCTQFGVNVDFDLRTDATAAWHSGPRAQIAFKTDLCRQHQLDLDAFSNVQFDNYRATLHTVTKLPGVERTLAYLVGRTLLGVVSDSVAEFVPAALGVEILRQLDTVVDHSSSPRFKPDPTGYLMAAARLNVHPSECLAVEDSEAGVSAALAAGMEVVASRAGHSQAQPVDHAHGVLDDLGQLIDYVKGRIAQPVREQTVVWRGVPRRISTFVTNASLNPALVTSAFALAADDSSSTLLVRHQTRGWDVPGGHCRPGEAPTDTAIRETFEESAASIVNLVPIGYDLVETLGEPPADETYPRPVSGQQFYAARVVSRQFRIADDEIAESRSVSGGGATSIDWVRRHPELFAAWQTQRSLSLSMPEHDRAAGTEVADLRPARNAIGFSAGL